MILGGKSTEIRTTCGLAMSMATAVTAPIRARRYEDSEGGVVVCYWLCSSRRMIVADLA